MVTRAALLPLVRKYFENDPGAAARSLETLDEAEAVSVLQSLPPTITAQALPHLDPRKAAALLKEVRPELFRDLAERLEPPQAASILLSLPKDAREWFLTGLSEKIRAQVQELLTYPENSVGRIMTRDLLAFPTDTKIKDVVQRLRQLTARHAPMSYSYAVDADNHLVGVLNMRDLLLAPGDETVGAVMRTDVFAVNGFMDREELASQLAKRRYIAVPVVDTDNRLLGVVKTEQLIQHVQEEAAEDIQRMVGAGGDEKSFSPVGFSLRKRLPWLYVNLATAFLAAAVVGLFQNLIARLTILAVFLPVVAGQGGNAGAQSLAIAIRGLVMREIPPSKAVRFILKEVLIGALNGAAIGLVTALVVWLWNGNPVLGVVIGLGMVVNLLAAGFAGAGIPLAMKAAGQDPAQSSSIIMTTVTDCIGNAAFLGFALVFEPLLR